MDYLSRAEQSRALSAGVRSIGTFASTYITKLSIFEGSSRMSSRTPQRDEVCCGGVFGVLDL